jgi:hypothetical protein
MFHPYLRWPPLLALAAVTGIVSSALAFDAALTDELSSSKYVYISSQRKDGSFSKPAEIWFFLHNGAVWVGTPTTSWRVKRIKAGRPAAKISVGSVDGPSFQATGAVANDAKIAELMFESFAKKYPDGWPKYEQRFRDGMKDGSRVLVKYTPK